MGKPPDPGYWRAWRAAHPEYRAREVERRRQRRLIHGREDRTTELARLAATRPSRALVLAPMPDLHLGHSLLDEAIVIATRHIRPDRRAVLMDPLFDDVVGAVVVAILAGTDPDAAARAARLEEHRHRWHQVPLVEY